MVENAIADPDVTAGRRWRFQLDNHLGTATLELDHEGNVISYEEYHPYGTSALRVQDSTAGVSQKRYRYTGKERDEETSLYYHGARYYAPWLGRWTAADPLGVAQPGKPDTNCYAYARGRAVRASDPGGMQEKDGVQERVSDRPSVSALVVDESSRDDRLQWHKKAVSALVPEGQAVETNSDNFNSSARTAAKRAGKGGTLVLASGHGTDAQAAADIVRDPDSTNLVAFSLTEDISVTRKTLDRSQWGEDAKTIKEYEFYAAEDAKRAEKGQDPVPNPNRPSRDQYRAAQERMVAREKLSALKGAIQAEGVARVVIAECGVGADKALVQATADFLGVRVTATSGDVVPEVQVKTKTIDGIPTDIETGMKLRVDSPAGANKGYVDKKWTLPLATSAKPLKKPG